MQPIDDQNKVIYAADDIFEVDAGQISKLAPGVLDPSPLTWKSAGATHIGRVRPVNEDAFFESASHQIWFVADGLGGHCRGDYASQTLVNVFADYIPAPTLADSLEDISGRLLFAHEKCRGAFRNKRVGTTIALLMIQEGLSVMLWAGDSRIYRMRSGALQLLTEDHSLAQEKLAKGELTLQQLEHHPAAHILTRAIGIHERLRVSCKLDKVLPGDRYLLCSDGLYNGLSRNDLAALLNLGNPRSCLDTLQQNALDRGGHDNITSIVVESSPEESH